MSLPTRERELKLKVNKIQSVVGTSLPTRERELKPPAVGDEAVDGVSLPTRERELKRRPWRQRHGWPRVAPHAGA